MKSSTPFEHLGKNTVVVLSLLAAGFFAAWLRYSPHLGSTGEFTDGLRQYDRNAEEPIRYAVWQEAQRLAGALMDGEAEHRPALSGDGRWLVFVSGDRGTNSELWISELVDGAAQEPRALFELNSTFDELSPAFRGRELFFASNRPGQGGFDLWRTTLDSRGECAPPEPLGESVNTRRDELDPAPLPEGGGLAFSSNRNLAGRRGHDFYLALPEEGGSFQVEPLEALNSWQDDRELSFTEDGRRAFFASNRGEGRPGSQGGSNPRDFDLYASLNDRGSWLPPVPVEGLNTTANERGPSPNHNGLELIFERQGRPASAGDVIPAELFQAHTLEVFQRPGPRVGWLDLLILIALLVLALLAVLAKRWDAIEVLYKCFLVSLIVHGALLYWFRDIHPESELKEFPKDSPAYQVKLIPSQRAIASRAERGGALEVERKAAAQELPASPERMAALAREAQAVQAPGQSTLARAAAPQVAVAAEAVEWQPSEAASQPTSTPLADAPRIARKALDRSAPAEAHRATDLQLVAQRTKQSDANTASAPGRLEAEAQVASHAAPSATVLSKEGPRPVESSGPSSGIVANPSQTQLASLTSTRDLRDPSAESPANYSKRSLSQSAEGTLLPEAGELAVNGRRATSEAESARLTRHASPSTLQPADHVQPGLLILEAQVAESPGALDLPDPEVAFHGEAPTVETLPEVPLPRATRVEPVRRRALSTSGDSLASLAAPAPMRFERRGRVTEGAAPAKPKPLAPALPQPSALVVPRASTVAPDQRIAQTPLPEPAVTRFEHTPYRSRFGPAKARALEEHGGNEQTEAAVAAGLAYLASVQRTDGSWGPRSARSEKYGDVRVGKTGLCLLAFLGAGHTAESATEHSGSARRAIEYLLETQHRRTGHFGATNAYGHGIATYALAECYALTGDPALEVPLKRAVEEILRHQNDRHGDARRYGGWGYYGAELRQQDRWPRASITAWQVMALESARLGGLHVPDEVFRAAEEFLVGCMDRRRGAFRYSHDPSRLNGSYSILPGSTPASLFALSLLEVDLEAPAFESAWQFLAQRSPQEYSYRGDDAFVYDAHGNLYFWYYGSLASMRRGGSTWKRWNAHLQETLLPSQREDGSWRPISIYAKDYARDHAGDASYSTAMNVLSLEVYYRYFTPLLKVSQGPASGRGSSGR